MITLFLKPRYYQSTAEAPLAGGIVARSYHDKPSISPTKSLKETGAHSEALAFSSSITNLLSVHLHPHIHSMDLRKFLLTVLLLSLLNYASYAAKSWEEDNFLKTCPPYRCNKHHEPEIRFRFGFQPTLHHAAHQGWSCHALILTRSSITQFLAPAK